MNRRNRTILVVGLALVLATLASFLVYRAVQSIPVREITIVERQQVVATQRIEAGQMITAERVRLTPWPAEAPVPGGFESIEAVVGRGVVNPILPNEPVTQSKLAGDGVGFGLKTMIPEGMRAMSIRVNDIVNVSGFVLPGARVDVIAIAAPGDNSETVSKIVLTNIEVVATNALTTQPEEENARQASNVTVFVTPEDGEKLALAANEGQIVLALRSALDVLPVETDGARMRALFAGPSPPPVRTVVSGRTRMVSQAPPAPEPPPTIQVIMGAQRSTVEVKSGRGGGGGEPGTGGNGGGGGGR